MKYAMKMVLIPESEYRRLKPEEGVRDKVNKILRGKRDRNAATEMSQLFGRYLRTTKPEQEKKSLSKEEIIQQLPPIYHEKVKNFLTELEKYGSTWTDNYEFVTKSGETIGNIVDLLKEAFVGVKGIRRDVPQGWKQFIQEIVAANIPRSAFGKKSTKDDIGQEKAQRRGPIPVQWENF